MKKYLIPYPPYTLFNSFSQWIVESTRNSNSVSNSYGYALCGFMFLLLMGVITYFNQKM